MGWTGSLLELRGVRIPVEPFSKENLNEKHQNIIASKKSRLRKELCANEISYTLRVGKTGEPSP